MSTHKLELKPRVRFRSIEEEGVLINLDSGRVIVVNELGLRVVELLRNPMTLQELGQVITNEFEVEEDQATADIGLFIEELNSEELLLAEQ